MLTWQQTGFASFRKATKACCTSDGSTPPHPAKGRELLEEHFHLIQQILEGLSRRSRLPQHEAEEFRSWALFKLVENDYRILESWKGRSSFRTFMVVVLVNLMRDYRIHVWGRWRPSAATRQRGPTAVLLEQFCVRDGLTVSEATERIRAVQGVSPSQSDLEWMAALPRLLSRRHVGEEVLLRVPVDGHVESRIQDSECRRTEDRLRELLAPLLRSLPAQDRLVLKLHYWDSLSIAAISLLLGLPQRELYSTRTKCLKRLRYHLECGGVAPDQARDLQGRSQLDLASFTT